MYIRISFKNKRINFLDRQRERSIQSDLESATFHRILFFTLPKAKCYIKNVNSPINAAIILQYSQAVGFPYDLTLASHFLHIDDVFDLLQKNNICC